MEVTTPTMPTSLLTLSVSYNRLYCGINTSTKFIKQIEISSQAALYQLCQYINMMNDLGCLCSHRKS